MVDQQAETSLSLEPTSLRFHFLILSHLSINMSWINGKLHGRTALEVNFLSYNQLLVNINQLFETFEKKKLFRFVSVKVIHESHIHTYY